jgi:glycosyltransferase involved in cell wall biosynthesis
MNHPLRSFFRWWFSLQLRQHCCQASAAAYVTEAALQRRYPPPSRGLATYYSDVELPPSSFVEQPRKWPDRSGSTTLITVGSLELLYKGTDVLIDSVLACVDSGLNLRLAIIGDGKPRAELEARAARLGDRVCFLGQVTAGQAVRDQLDQSDLFVLPSRAEGLPRAMVEAMARGLPCIGSTVGGIPELLLQEDMVPPGDSKALSDKIREVTMTPGRLGAMSIRNLDKAHEYRQEAVRQRQLAFLKYLRETTEAWMVR